MAAAEPVSAKSFMKRAKPSATKLPPNVTTRSAGIKLTSSATRTISATAAQLVKLTTCADPKTPAINSAITPTASTISGSTGSTAGSAKDPSMTRAPLMRYELGGLKPERVVIIVKHGGYRGGRQF